MAIGTRDYARSYVMGGGLPYGIKMLVIANVAVFLAQFFGGDILLSHYFALQPAALFTSLAVWQLATYMFLHGGIWHILFNMLALWMFGRELEGTWGTSRFIQFYFFCGIGAGICVVLANYLLPGGDPTRATIGASGAIYGILMACAMLWPDQIIYFNFLFPIKMKYFVMIYGAIAFLGSTNMNSGVSDIGHLGGLLFAYLFIKMPRVHGLNPMGALEQQYKAWKLARNKRKFQVYMKKNSRAPRKDPWVN